METMIINVVLCIAVPLAFLCGIVDQKSRQILFAVLLGCASCMVACYFNTWFYNALGCSNYYLTTNVAPFVEEIFKFLPILLFARFYSNEKKTLLSISFAVGMGFAIIENSFMLSQYADSATILWIIIRGLGTGLMHGISTTIVGIGIYLAFKDKKIIFTGTLATLLFAMMYHGAYNAIIQTDVIKYFGIFIPLISYSVVIVLAKKNKLDKMLIDID